MNKLTTTEQSERSEIDATLAETKVSANRHFDALFRCHQKGLWRSTHTSFKDYFTEHSNLKESAIYRAIKAETIRREVTDCSTATVVTDRTALALEKLKPNRRKKTFDKAAKLAKGKTVSPTHINKASGKELPKGGLCADALRSQQSLPPLQIKRVDYNPYTNTHQPATQLPIPLNPAQEKAVQQWAADDRLWTTQETVAHNLRTFARLILQS